MTLSLQNITGVGPAVALQLKAAGITTIEQLAVMTPTKLMAIKGLGKARAATVLAAAKKLKTSLGRTAAPGASAGTKRATTTRRATAATKRMPARTKAAGKRVAKGDYRTPAITPLPPKATVEESPATGTAPIVPMSEKTKKVKGTADKKRKGAKKKDTKKSDKKEASKKNDGNKKKKVKKVDAKKSDKKKSTKKKEADKKKSKKSKDKKKSKKK